MAQKVKILDVRKIPSGAPDRVGRYDMICTYQIDPLRTYIVTLPAEEFDEAKLKTAIRKDMDKRAEFEGREIEV